MYLRYFLWLGGPKDDPPTPLTQARECKGVTTDSISQSQDGIYESLTLSTPTKSHICKDCQLLESFTEAATGDGLQC